jgi:hypothetical protein
LGSIGELHKNQYYQRFAWYHSWQKSLDPLCFQLFLSDIWVFHLIDLIANIYKVWATKIRCVWLIFVLIDKKLFLNCCGLILDWASIFVMFINNQPNLSDNPDRADILWALGRLPHCPQIKARAGIWWIDNAQACCF